MVVHQVLCKGTQGSKALIRDTLRPEDNPRVVGEGDGDDCEPEQAAPLEVACTWGRPHRSSGVFYTRRGERLPVHQTQKVSVAGDPGNPVQEAPPYFSSSSSFLPPSKSRV